MFKYEYSNYSVGDDVYFMNKKVRNFKAIPFESAWAKKGASNSPYSGDIDTKVVPMESSDRQLLNGTNHGLV